MSSVSGDIAFVAGKSDVPPTARQRFQRQLCSPVLPDLPRHGESVHAQVAAKKAVGVEAKGATAFAIVPDERFGLSDATTEAWLKRRHGVRRGPR